MIIGFASGCFDAFHPGHVYFLNSCRRRCSRLIVAINSDASVTQLKGKGRPVDDWEGRAANVRKYLYDPTEVYEFDGDEELAWLIGKLKPDLIFKGGDYSMETVVGRDLVSRVCQVPRLEGFSTSEIVGNGRMDDQL